MNYSRINVATAAVVPFVDEVLGNIRVVGRFLYFSCCCGEWVINFVVLVVLVKGNSCLIWF